MKLQEFLSEAWKGYVRLTPDAPVIHAALEARGEHVINDHVAFRTFNLPGITRAELGAVFEAWGYARANETLDFPEKKLKASYYLHPDRGLPKIFVSELLIERVSPALQEWIRDFARPTRKASPELLLEPSWAPVGYADYERFYAESEYAAWTAAFGVRLNHFTVLVNALKTFQGLEGLNAFLIERGLKLNAAGGVIKGTPKDCLEQSSTLARRIPWNFAQGEPREIMGCYYEFARRYPHPRTGELFQGFVPASADKIFESTFESAHSKAKRT